MANELINRTLVNGSPRFLFLLSGKIDTAETDVTKIDISTLPGITAVAANQRIRINKIFWSCSGLTVKLAFDRAVNPEAIMLIGTGWIKDPIEDVGSGAGTGDLKLSTQDLLTTAEGRGYTIEIEVEIKQQ